MILRGKASVITGSIRDVDPAMRRLANMPVPQLRMVGHGEIGKRSHPAPSRRLDSGGDVS
jgi:hypothetical protein